MNVWSMNLYPPRYNKQIICLISNYNMYTPFPPKNFKLDRLMEIQWWCDECVNYEPQPGCICHGTINSMQTVTNHLFTYSVYIQRILGLFILIILFTLCLVLDNELPDYFCLHILSLSDANNGNLGLWANIGQVSMAEFFSYHQSTTVHLYICQR